MTKTVNGESYQVFSPWYNRIVTYTPIFWVDDNGNRHFIQNLASNTGSSFDEKQQRADIQKMLGILELNGYKYMPIYLNDNFSVERENLESFLNWKESNGYTLEKCLASYDDVTEPGTVYFDGNMNEYCAAFRFAIYDKDLQDKCRKIFDGDMGI